MGLKSTLIQWHKNDPVDDFERRHNEAVYANQGNRNPFIDHPEYAVCVFESDCSGSDSLASTDVWINELHYGNNGSDQNEFVEVAGAANTNLTGWKLIVYNGIAYKTISLSGAISNQQNGYGTISF